MLEIEHKHIFEGIFTYDEELLIFVSLKSPDSDTFKLGITLIHNKTEEFSKIISKQWLISVIVLPFFSDYVLINSTISTSLLNDLCKHVIPISRLLNDRRSGIRNRFYVNYDSVFKFLYSEHAKELRYDIFSFNILCNIIIYYQMNNVNLDTCKRFYEYEPYLRRNLDG